MTDDQFYKDKAWELLMAEIGDIKKSVGDLGTKLEAQRECINSINSKMRYIYGFAGGASFVFSFVWFWLKEEFAKWFSK